MARVLVVDDEAPIVDAIAYNLQKEGFTVDTAGDADECLSRVQANVPNLILLDVMLPSGSGLDICRRLHQDYADLPVLLLTARAAEVDRLRGFDAGADDYVVKPFSMRELMARVHALLRRTGQAPPPATVLPLATLALPTDAGVILEGIAINADRREVLKNGVSVALSRKEFDLLALLAAHKGRVFDRQTLLSRVWGEDCYVDDRTVDVHIRWLREKLELTPARPELLLTVRGVGYKFRG